MTHLTDQELVAQYLLTGDGRYFAQLYTRHRQRVYQKCLSHTGNAFDSEDYVQDIFMRLAPKLKSYKGDAKFTTWLYAVTNNYCIDKLRKQQQEQTFWLAYRYECCSSGDQLVGRSEETYFKVLEQVLGQLPAKQRDLLLNKYQKGKPIKEIASCQNLTQSAVKMRIKRARELACVIYSKILLEEEYQ